MTPKQRYKKDLQRTDFYSDEAQARAVDALDNLYHQWIDYLNQPVVRPSLWHKLLGKRIEPTPPPKGLYMWGGVGRGKTYLMDTFFESLPNDKKLRVHFHRFMYRVHDELRSLSEVSDPLEIVADRFCAEANIICFDEFFVSDITDAMILGTLFEALFRRGVVLVATSNIAPKDLYRNGLQRARFLPAIALVETHCHILNVDSGVDYRLRTLQQAEIYHYPLDEKAADNLQRYFRQLISSEHKPDDHIEVNHRLVPVNAACDGVLYATFAQLCQTARSQYDYIELSKIYHTVLLADVKQMNKNNDDAARRFIALVDEFYERHVKLIVSAEVAVSELYSHGLLEFEFKRCQSRLIEMQSHDYLAKEHLV
ncbi:cell division protein ZapE [Vibrio metoecus]|uniref:cell division protein ZapE n=1 Tax=Vibrio TaxID=662 RepID=UPI0001B99943|nr:MULTISPECIES: cell division protein ZapE [Vibrio]EEX67443.1 predicted ATPase [Vibrio metoecus]KQA98342.1 ATPase [Vibrio metoecus]KQB05641.1 ATPase [Vibrio metoecus]MDP4492099.1 cell division protein ZapE [Vibrio sp. AH4]PAR28213.1 cell division protein ZapE [Vibrio metoecus]